ncbi:MAG: hypothetical protein AAF340_18145 [Pseudomonadota bacterium]
MHDPVDESGGTDVPEGKDVLISITCNRGLARHDKRSKQRRFLWIAAVLFVIVAISAFSVMTLEAAFITLFIFFGLLITVGRLILNTFIERRNAVIKREAKMPSSWANADYARCDITDDMLYFSFRPKVPVSDITSVDIWGNTLTLRRARRGYKAIKLKGVDFPKEFAEILRALISTRDPRTGKSKA